MWLNIPMKWNKRGDFYYYIASRPTGTHNTNPLNIKMVERLREWERVEKGVRVDTHCHSGNTNKYSLWPSQFPRTGTKNISWIKATTFSSGFMVITREATDCSRFLLYFWMNASVVIQLHWDRLLPSYLLLRAAEGRMVLTRRTHAHGKSSDTTQWWKDIWTFLTPVSWSLSKGDTWIKRAGVLHYPKETKKKLYWSEIMHRKQKVHVLYPWLHTEFQWAWSRPKFSPSYLISNGVFNSFLPTLSSIPTVTLTDEQYITNTRVAKGMD